MLKFPRTELASEELAKLEAYFTADLRPLYPDLDCEVSFLAFTNALQEALKTTARTGHLHQGLESIAKQLETEKIGLDAVAERTAAPVGQRMSRLLLISNDGSERFHHQVAALVVTHGHRLWVAKLEASSEELGALISSRGNPAKAVMIGDKKALALFLMEICRRTNG